MPWATYAPFLVYMTTGAVAGLLAGLLGIGGGLVIVPILLLVFEWQHVSPEVLTHLALGTSLATIVATSSSSTYAHHQKQGVRWTLFAWIVPGIMLGASLGVSLAARLSGQHLQLLIGLYALASSLKMAFEVSSKPSRPMPGPGALLGIGVLVGGASALFGIGGGSLLVPLLYWCSLRMQEAVGTAAACGLPLALVGAVTNAWVGWGHSELPFGALGYVHLPAAVGVVVVSLPCARWGAQLAHRVPASRLRKIFALFLGVVGVELVLVSLLRG